MVLAYVLIMVEAGKEREVARKLLRYKEIDNLHILFGEYDLIAKVICKDIPRLQAFIIDNIRSLRSVGNTSTLIAADVTEDTDKNPLVK